MTDRSKRNRRVPPRGNPDETQQHENFTTSKPQSATIPWSMLILTTGLTTITGYVFLEVIRGAHRYVRGRKEDKLAEANPPPEQNQIPPGPMANGGFQLPLPEGISPQDFSGPTHGGFGTLGRAAPPLTEVSTPMGQLRHQVGQHQYNVDARLDRIERLLNQHYGDTG